jgi:hypothetical protein
LYRCLFLYLHFKALSSFDDVFNVLFILLSVCLSVCFADRSRRSGQTGTGHSQPAGSCPRQLTPCNDRLERGVNRNVKYKKPTFFNTVWLKLMVHKYRLKTIVINTNMTNVNDKKFRIFDKPIKISVNGCAVFQTNFCFTKIVI